MQTEIRHHLNDELLMAYSAGTLPEAFSLVVATHVSLCDECRARLDAIDSVGGAVLNGVDEVDVSEDSLDRVLKMIESEDRALPRVAPKHVTLPEPLRSYVGGDVDAVKWRRVGGGVKQAVLDTGGTESVRMLYIPGGVAVPDHTHGGMELTLVLQGAFRDEVDRFGRGDIEIADSDLDHQPVAEEGEPCICLAATDAPLAFKGLVPRIAQRFVGI
ncbi:MAG: ChrR family anti-sigma-E factor [Pseudomonadota bacterium]